ncbi:MAG: MFS transporter, partial [Leptolyngbya sp.]|nr:MFS transporter [Candidatus Melainabacteria bacterium]
MLTRELRAPAPVKAKRQQRHPRGEKKVAENTKWHALISAWLGEAFDAMDASLYFVALVPAMSELLGTHNETLIGQYGSFVLAIFMMGWFVGAVAFGTLADRIGRRKTMLLTILIYSAATGLCALCQDWIQLSVCRFIVGCGIGGEICLGTVVVAEFWKGRSRLWATCLLESSFNAGLLLSAGINAALGVYGWRWMFLVGVVPALATIYIRSKLKESDAFQEVSSHREQARNTEIQVAKPIDSAVLKSPFAQLMAPDMKPRLIVVASLCASAIVGFWACVSWLPAWTNQLTGTVAVA